MTLDNVFNEPDILPESHHDERRPVVQFMALGTRTGGTWTMTVDDPPGGRPIQVEGPTWIETKKAVAQALFAACKDQPGETFSFRALPTAPAAADALRDMIDARVALVHAQQTLRDAVRAALATLTEQGWDEADIAHALMLRPNQLAWLREHPFPSPGGDYPPRRDPEPGDM